MKPLVSVVIPAYNSCKYISEALTSVLSQTYKNFEIIVVDDGSTDKTREIVEKFQIPNSKFQIKYIYQENKGPSAARNRGIKEAKGECLAFLDSDDAWASEKLEKQIKILKQNEGVGLICTGRIRIEERTNGIQVDCKGNYLSEDSYLDLWQVGNFIITSSVLAKKECFDKVGFFDESEETEGAEDWDMWLRILEYYKLAYINESLINYSVSEYGHKRSNIERAYRSVAYVVNKHKDKLKEKYKRHSVILKNLWFRYYLNYGKALISAQKVKESNYRFIWALKYKPYSLKALFYFLATFRGF